jgi:hypothetical protein
VRRRVRNHLLSLFVLAAAVGGASPTPALAQECANEAVRAQQGSTYLPDCRAYELVSPQEKNGSEVLPHVSYQSEIPFQAAASGASVMYSTTGGLLETGSSGHASFYLGASAGLGNPWSNTSLNPESRFGVRTGGEGGTAGSTGEYRYLAPNLNCAVMETSLPQGANAASSTPLLPEGETAGESISNLYVWRTADSSRVLATPVKPDNPSELDGFDYRLAGTTSNCENIFFQSEYQFLGVPRDTRVGSTESRTNALYEWRAAASPQLRVASVLPDGKLAGPVRSDNGMANLVSADGRRVFFEAPIDAGSDPVAGEAASTEVLVREDGTRTIDVSRSQTATPDLGASYELASTDGSNVLFLANNKLAASASSGSEIPPACTSTNSQQRGCELYDYNLETGDLSDISADSNPSDKSGSGVQGVLGASADGSFVYFSATGQLVSGEGNTQLQNDASSGESALGIPKTEPEANIYVAHAGNVGYIATIAAKEAAGFVGFASVSDATRGAPPVGLKLFQSRVDPTGLHALFVTREPVHQSDGETYDNVDRVTGNRDFETYEYDAGSETTLCTSCRPDGEPPTQSNIVSPKFDYEVNLDATQHNLASDGRVFFTSLSPLVPQAVNETLNVYEWTPDGVGGCEGAPGCTQILDSGTDPSATYFEGASDDSENVYVTTYGELSPFEDGDELRDLYDVRAGGGLLYTPPTSGCSDEGCQAPGQAPGEGPPRRTEQDVGNGNLAPGKAGVGSGDVKSFSVHLVKGARALLSVTTPDRGSIRLSGRGLKTLTMPVAKSGVYHLSASLTGKERRLLKRHHRITLTARVAYTGPSGAVTAVNSRVTFT